ncbi:sulfite exporter TauE/SafE family protein [Clostridium aestuarii]|uniref:Probable membrane transporter protein n=1 Tax=Clostridium aestuarii TaxID=338193 RepID=A0ABT4CZE7_9CLOT|nr:sulfite exporter TauE/SafE family protein [Clostridium aestuarii]MCY6484197.1 sulfite exporter TauE/SafE family protein [Clostridium aestuarii]
MGLQFYLLSIFIGIVCGSITSLIGASGVMVIVPILTMFFNISVHAAIGTSLFVDVVASLTVSYSYYKNGNIDLKSSIWIALTSIIGAQLGASLASNMGESNLSSSFGIVLIIAGLSMLLKSYKNKTSSPNKINKFICFKSEWQKILASLIIGLGIGVLSGVFGAGGGVMILFALISIMSFPLHKAIGTSTLIMAITALSSTIGYAAKGNINFMLSALISIGAILGGIIGSRYANNINEKTLKKIVGICFTLMGVIMTILAKLK